MDPLPGMTGGPAARGGASGKGVLYSGWTVFPAVCGKRLLVAVMSAAGDGPVLFWLGAASGCCLRNGSVFWVDRKRIMPCGDGFFADGK